MDLQWAVQADNVQLTLASAGKVLWHDRVAYTQGDDDSRVFAASAEASERFSRTVWPDILRQAGFTGAAIRASKTGAAPPAVSANLRALDIIHQYAALRLTHAAITKSGFSPQRLSVLVQAYANLARLTDLNWSAANDAYAARSILYAQKMVVADPNSAFAHFNRAYAFALAGCHHFALDDMAAAKALIQSGKNDDDKSLATPAWVPTIDTFCRYDVGTLSQGLSNDQTAPLAALLCFFSVEDCGSTVPVEYAKLALQVEPNCVRLADGMNFISGIGIMGQVTEEVFPVFSRTVGIVANWPDAPAPVRNDLHQMRDTKNPYQIDIDAAKAMFADDDAAEPSYPALGRIIQDVYFAHLFNRAFFVDQMLGTDASEVVAYAKPLVEGYPYAAWLDCFTGDRTSTARYAPLTTMTIVDPTPGPNLSTCYFARIAVNGTNAAQQAWDLLDRQHDCTAQNNDQFLGRIPNSSAASLVEVARRELVVGPYDAIARAVLIEHDYDNIKSQLPQWQQQLGEHPAILLALAHHAVANHDNDQARDFFNRYLKIAPDITVYEELANLYLQQGDEANWLKTMKAALEAPDYGLGRSTIQIAIANHYMDTGNYNAAKPYAQAAVESYSEPSMGCMIRCAEGLKDWPTASHWVESCTQRYGTVLYWYLWCQRTGHGNLQQATSAAEAVAPQISIMNGRELCAQAFEFYYLQGQPDKAMAMLHNMFDPHGDPWAGLNLAILQDRAGDHDGAMATLDQVVQRGPQDHADGEVRTQMISLAGLLKTALQQNGQLDMDAVKNLAGNSSRRDAAHIDFLAAEFLETHHQMPEQVGQLLHSAARAAEVSTSGLLAEVELRKQKS